MICQIVHWIATRTWYPFPNHFDGKIALPNAISSLVRPLAHPMCYIIPSVFLSTAFLSSLVDQLTTRIIYVMALWDVLPATCAISSIKFILYTMTTLYLVSAFESTSISILFMCSRPVTFCVMKTFLYCRPIFSTQMLQQAIFFLLFLSSTSLPP